MCFGNEILNTEEQIKRAEKMGIPDLERLSLLNLVDFYHVELKSGRYRKISEPVRRFFRAQGVITFNKIYGNKPSFIELTAYGKKLMHEVEKRW